MPLIVISMSCQSIGAPPPKLAPDDVDVRLSTADARTMRASCALAENRCSRCHTLDRIVLHEAASPRHWQEQVARMRRIAGSTISRHDGDSIVRCLVYRSFGSAGLATLPDPSSPGASP
jgi:hypothetical protein